MTENIQYEITKTSITDNNDVFVAFKCYVDGAELFESAVIAVHDTTLEDIQEQINDRAYNMATSILSAKEIEDERKNKDKEKNDSCKSLKSLIDEEIGKKKPIKKLEKKEKKNDRKR